MQANWAAPDTAGIPPITGYDVRYRKSGATAWTDFAHTGTGVSASITGLDADSAYEVQVSARNAEGDSDWSATGSGNTDAERTPLNIALSVAPAQLPESAPGQDVEVTAALSRTPFADESILLVTVGSGTATAGEDFDAVADFEIEIPAGARTVSGAFRLTLIDDAIEEPTETILVNGALDGAVVTGAEIRITSDDSAGLAVSASSLDVSEGDQVTYTVRLTSAPAGTVWVTPEASEASALTVSPETLTFDASNWSEEQSIVVTAADDDVDRGDREVRIRHAVTGYGDIAEGAPVDVRVRDNDSAGVLLSEASVTVAEAGPGNAASWEAVLASEPVGDVTLSAESRDPGIARVLPASVTFGPSDWNRPRTFEVTAVDDQDENAMARTTVIEHRVRGGGYDGIEVASVAVRVEDDDAGRREQRGRMVGSALAGLSRTIGSDAVQAMEERLATVTSPAAADRERTAVEHPLLDRLERTPVRGEPAGTLLSHSIQGLYEPDRPYPAQPGQQIELAPSLVGWSPFNSRFGSGDRGIWGSLSQSRFAARVGEDRGDGELTTGYLGFDAPVGGSLVGVLLSHSLSDIDVSGLTDGAVETSLTTIQPYLIQRYEHGAFWSLLGYGIGEAELSDAAGKETSDLSMWMSAIGGRRELSGSNFAIKGDAFLTSIDTEDSAQLPESPVQAYRLRMLMEGRWQRQAKAGDLGLTAEFGGRWDGGQAQGGFGAVVGGGLEFRPRDSRFSLAGTGRYTVAHDAGGFEDWSMGLTLGMAPGARGQGFRFAFSPVWGDPAADAQRLWASAPGAYGSFADRQAAREIRWRPDRYRLEFGHGRLTPAGLVDLSVSVMEQGYGQREYRLGGQWNASGHSGWHVMAELFRREGVVPDHGVLLSARLTPRGLPAPGIPVEADGSAGGATGPRAAPPVTHAGEPPVAPAEGQGARVASLDRGAAPFRAPGAMPRPSRSLYHLPAGDFVVQLIALSTEAALDAFVAERSLEALPRVRLARNGRQFHVLLLGAWPTRAAAERAAAALPAQVADLKPWVRTAHSLQEAMRDAASAGEGVRVAANR